MKTLLFLFTVISLSITTLKAQETTLQNQPYIEVTGTAEKEIIPDEIYINILIKERYEGRDKITIETQEEKLKNAVRELGIDLANLTLSDANANYIRVKWWNKDVMAQKEYILKVADAFTVGKVFQKLDEIEITNAYVSRVNHSKIDSIRREIRIMAIKDAKTKADYLLTSIGEKPGKPLIIQERPVDDTPLLNMQRGAVNYDYERLYVTKQSSSFNEQQISFRKIKLTCFIYAKFAVK